MPAIPNALFASLADPTRRAIFERLCCEGEQTDGALADRTGVSQPAVSKRLGVLKRAWLVGFGRGRFDRLKSLLDRMDR